MKMMMFAAKVIIFTMVVFLLGVGLLEARQADQKDPFTHHRSDLFSILSTTQNQHVNIYTFEFEETSLNEVLHEIANRGNWKILTNSTLIPEDHTVTAELQHVNLFEAFNRVLEGTGLDFIYSGKGYVIIVPREEEEPVQEEIVTGRVVDSQTGESLPGVNILIEGTDAGTTTDADGYFELTVPNLQEVLIFTYIGYERQEVDLAGRDELIIELTSEVIAGDELVVVGYGTQRRSDLTGSVSSIDRRDILELPVYSMDNVLQGRAAGVQVIDGGYRPGEASSIRIRGVRSFSASNEPLVVMDGIAMEGGVGALMELNPRDIESVEVLKDASASAIYGSRGANGVILVTTRRGFEGRINIEYSGYAGVQYTFDRLDMMDTGQYTEFYRDAHRMDGTYTGNDEDIFEQWQLDAIAENRTTNWQDLVLESGFQQNHTLSIRGGSEDTRYAISGTLDDHQATVINNDYRRLSTRINVDQNISSRVRTGISAFISNSMRNEAVGFGRVVKNSPMSNPYDQHGNIVMEDELGDRNPLFDMQRENNLNEENRTRIIGTVYAEADIIPERLSIRANFSPDFRFRKNASYRRDLTSTASKWQDDRLTTLAEAILDYRTTLFQDHRVRITGMYSIQNHSNEEIRVEGRGLPYEHQLYHNLQSANEILRGNSTRTGLTEWTLESTMFRTNYVYNDRYLLTFTGRVDGSSRLAEGNKYSFFPSMALAWQLGNESFMQGADIFSELKLRFSIGETGNTSISPYQTQGVLSLNSHDFGGTRIDYFEHGSIPNHDLRWERTRSMDLGLDFALMADRVRGSIDIYQSDTYDLLMQRQLPFTSGYTSTLENVGETRNRGLEFELSSVNVQNPNFMWSTDLNFSTNRNEIISLHGEKKDDIGNRWFIGQPISVHYYWQFDGIWQLNEAEEAVRYGAQPGDIRVVDVTGDSQITDDDRVILGSPYPKWTTGLTNRLQYKNWDFSLFVYVVYGSTHHSSFGSASFDDILSLQAHAYQENQRNVPYWLPDRPSNQYQRPRIGGNTYTQAQAYFDTSYLRVRNVSLGYTIPHNVLTRLGAHHFRIYASVQNPITFTSFEGYDPEGARGYDMPNYTTFLLGVDLSF